MLFNSLEFIVFFPIVLLVNFILPKKVRYLWLLAASYYFYMCWNAEYALLLLFSTVITFLSGTAMEFVKHRGYAEQKCTRLKKLCVGVSFTLNLAVLVFFKYYGFLAENLSAAFRVFDVQLQVPQFDVLLPVGISFFTFQALSYTMDVYRDEIPAEKNFFRYALFVSFFPQLVAGPIERSKNLLEQLANPQPLKFKNLQEGVLLMIWGYFLKIVVADRVAIFVDTVYGNPAQFGGFYLIAATIFFAVQIYCDFAGYSVVATGVARILGIQLMENFNAPYLSRSVPEFWRRWHISLSSWFRDYLYVPLGGNRKGTVRKYFNLLVVFFVSGLWHGASWNFVIWGALNGFYQVFGALLKPMRDFFVKLLHLNRESFGHRLLQTVTTFALVDVSWIFFRANSLSAAKDILYSMTHVFNPWILLDGSLFHCGLSEKQFRLMIFTVLILLAADICKYHGIVLRKKLMEQDLWFRWLVMIGAILFILVFGVWGTGYDQAGFIYFQF